MIIYHDEDEYETVYEHRTCPFHEMHPGETFAGCTCSYSVSQRRRSPAEIAEIKAKRRLAEEDEILRKAEAIRLRRSSGNEGEQDG